MSLENSIEILEAEFASLNQRLMHIDTRLGSDGPVQGYEGKNENSPSAENFSCRMERLLIKINDISAIVNSINAQLFTNNQSTMPGLR